MTTQKWGALALYTIMAVVAVALAGSTTAQVITWIFIGLAVVHLIEFALNVKVLQVASGSMANHFIHTLLFGYVHWLPLKKQQAAQSASA